MNLKPRFQLGIFYQQRSGLEDKLGGLPFGFPEERWPRCKVCGLAQNYIAQFRHSDKVNLGGDGRTLFLFQCPDGAVCGTWKSTSGANAAILLEAEALTQQPTSTPEGTEVEPEGVIVGWEPAKPSEWITYVGPEPSYGPTHDESSAARGRFVLQLVGSLDFTSPSPSPNETGAQHMYYWGGLYGQDNVRVEEPPQPREHFGTWSRGQSNHPGRPSQILIRENGEWTVEWANFGGGSAYVLMDDETGQVHFFSEN